MTDIRYLLNVGRDHARTIGELAETLNVPRRSVEESIQSARLDGVPIISGSEGVWLGTDEEALAWCERQRSRAIHLMETAQAVQRAAEDHRASLGEAIQTELGWVA